MNYKFYHFKSLTSTQDKAKEFAKKGLSNVVIVSDFQTNGRGRFKRKWYSSKGGLWMSILLKSKYSENLQYLTFIAAIAAVKSIKKITGIDTKIKWPNDVHYKGKKLCGILTEGIFGKENYVIVGSGLNVNQIKFSADIKNTATSLRIIKNKKINIGKLRKNIADDFFHIYSHYFLKNNLGGIIKTWKSCSDTINRHVAVMTIAKELRGRAVGIDKSCNLLLKLKSNKVIKITEGDIHIRYQHAGHAGNRKIH